MFTWGEDGEIFTLQIPPLQQSTRTPEEFVPYSRTEIVNMIDLAAVEVIDLLDTARVSALIEAFAELNRQDELEDVE